MVFGDSVLKGVIYENNIYKVSQNRFSNICEDILGVPIENKAKFGSTISIGKNIIFKNIELIKETKSKYVVMVEFGGNDCDYKKFNNRVHWNISVSYRWIKKIWKEPVLLSLPPIDSTKYFDYISKKLNADNILKWMEGNKKLFKSTMWWWNIPKWKSTQNYCRSYKGIYRKKKNWINRLATNYNLSLRSTLIVAFFYLL